MLVSEKSKFPTKTVHGRRSNRWSGVLSFVVIVLCMALSAIEF